MVGGLSRVRVLLVSRDLTTVGVQKQKPLQFPSKYFFGIAKDKSAL